MSEGGEEEERRLFYVAITRAKEHLVLTRAQQRYRYGQHEPRYPSPFLRDIPEDLAEVKESQDFFQRISVEEQKAAFAEILRKLREEQDF